MIKTNFKINVEINGDTPIYSAMIDAFRSCGIKICNSYQYTHNTHGYHTYIDKEKQFGTESMARRLVLLPYAIINILEECHIRPFVTVSIERMPIDPKHYPCEIRLFTINRDYQVDYDYSA